MSLDEGVLTPQNSVMIRIGISGWRFNPTMKPLLLSLEKLDASGYA
jgi:hypothetical protein